MPALSSLRPGWTAGYRRAWLRPDLLAGVVIWSVVTPQAVAYAQIAGLPPEAGLMAAPVAMIGYGLLGTSHQLVVSATTATSAGFLFGLGLSIALARTRTTSRNASWRSRGQPICPPASSCSTSR